MTFSTCADVGMVDLTATSVIIPEESCQMPVFTWPKWPVPKALVVLEIKYKKGASYPKYLTFLMSYVLFNTLCGNDGDVQSLQLFEELLSTIFRFCIRISILELGFLSVREEAYRISQAYPKASIIEYHTSLNFPYLKLFEPHFGACIRWRGYLNLRE